MLLVNLLTFFRISLFTQIVAPHTPPGRANYAVEILLAALLEFKAFTVFSLLFGVGMGIQAGRLPARFLVRRFLVLLLFGVCHMTLLSNVDILCLYAVCGLLLLPLTRLPSRVLAALGVLGLAATLLPLWSKFVPDAQALRIQGELATRIYATGSFAELLRFRWDETRRFILPLLFTVFPRTLGVMLLGLAAWKTGALSDPRKHRAWLAGVAVGAGTVGMATTLLQTWSQESGRWPVSDTVLSALSTVPLALAYAAGLLLWLSGPRAGFLAPLLAAVGRLSLSNYLGQSLVLGFLFYGYGLGLCGRFGSAAALGIGIALYLTQVLGSVLYLRRFRFGPMEWLWRTLTYGAPP